MSAFVVDTDHIDAMVTAGLTGRGPYGPMRWYVGQAGPYTLDESTADRVGAMLLAECIKSVSARYPDDGPGELPGPVPNPEVQAYRFRQVQDSALTPVVALKLIDCYEYQSCEHDGWTASEAHAFCAALRHAVIGRLPGYDAGPWGYQRPAGSPVAGRAHTIMCGEAEARSQQGEQLLLTPGPCWCGSPMPERKAKKTRKRSLTLAK